MWQDIIQDNCPGLSKTEISQKTQKRVRRGAGGPDLRGQKEQGGQRVDPLLDPDGNRERKEDDGRIWRNLYWVVFYANG